MYRNEKRMSAWLLVVVVAILCGAGYLCYISIWALFS